MHGRGGAGRDTVGEHTAPVLNIGFGVLPSVRAVSLPTFSGAACLRCQALFIVHAEFDRKQAITIQSNSRRGVRAKELIYL